MDQPHVRFAVLIGGWCKVMEGSNFLRIFPSEKEAWAYAKGCIKTEIQSYRNVKTRFKWTAIRKLLLEKGGIYLSDCQGYGWWIKCSPESNCSWYFPGEETMYSIEDLVSDDSPDTSVDLDSSMEDKFDEWMDEKF